MANTTFTGPVRSENGFQSVTKNATTGAVTADSTFGDDTTIGNDLTVGGDLDAQGTANIFVVPTSDPGVAGALWNDAGTLSVSAG
jgi:hypothetical protein